ncbi:MAG: HU family DNA-binding protein [Deltaproteobacteria bacterium]|nr:HU family DNA-binding protein [Deltaproteobacteria bacterium]MCB9785239.1 HU family DNA-binding protein [Deltaproteobacteria bacterium]
MTKAELVSKIAGKAGITKAQANDALTAATEAIGAALLEGKKTTLPGFGTFSVSERAARTGRNPQTGKSIRIPASTGVRFSASSTLKDALN